VPNSATRLITLIMLLQRQPNQKAGELAEKLGVSVRTLHRYLDTLDEMGIPVYSERGPYGGFSLARGYRMPPLVFTPEEATAVALGVGLVSDIWGQLYHEAAAGALAKLDNVLPNEQRNEIAWARRSLVVANLHRADLSAFSATLEKLRRAVRELRRVTMVYHTSGRPEPQGREIDPYALVHQRGWWYVIGFCHLRQEVRTFRVDRIRELSLLSQVFATPADFDVHEYLRSEFEHQPQLHSRLRFAPQAAHIVLSDRAAWQNVEEQPDGAVIVSLETPDLEWAASTVLSFGPWVSVIEPEELRQMVMDWARGFLAQGEKNS
jgi:predicted DNA-binding transcriptional regulator YafY